MVTLMGSVAFLRLILAIVLIVVVVVVVESCCQTFSEFFHSVLG